MTPRRAAIDLETAKLCVGPGWHPLLDLLYTALPRDTVVTQVKEKFGGLRFYVDAAPEEFHDLVFEVEKISMYVCESCGRLGTQNRKGWIKTLCEECRE